MDAPTRRRPRSPAAAFGDEGARPFARRSRFGRARIGLLLALAGATVAAAAFVLPRSGRRSRCDPAPIIRQVWDEARAEMLIAAIERSVSAPPVALGPALRDQLDAHADAWSRHYRRRCEDPGFTSEADELERRCLLRQLEELDALLDVVGEADPAVLERALDAVATLPSPPECLDPAHLATLVAPPENEAIAGPLERLREGLVTLRTLERLGRAREAAVVTRGLVAEAQRLDHAPVLAELLWRRGRQQQRRGDTSDARASYERAIELGTERFGAQHAFVARATRALDQLEREPTRARPAPAPRAPEADVTSRGDAQRGDAPRSDRR